jgi:hypothetical protein
VHVLQGAIGALGHLLCSPYMEVKVRVLLALGMLVGTNEANQVWPLHFTRPLLHHTAC